MTMRRVIFSLLGLTLIGAGAASGQEAPRSTMSGVYTAAQAEEGQILYQKTCSECHARDEFTPEMMAGWGDAPLYDLWDLITTTMPENNPGSLSRSEYVSVLAYILALNDMPPGEEELSSRASVLRNILFSWRAKQ